MVNRWRINGGIIGNEINYSDNDSGVWSLESPYLNLNVGPTGEALFTTTGTNIVWTIPTGVTDVACVCIGGGGGGSASTLSSNGVSGGGGGGGGLHWRNLTGLTPGDTLQVYVGGGGNGGSSAGNNNAAAGVFSRILNASGSTFLLRANGGSKGSYNVSSTGSASGGLTYFGTYGGGGGQGGGGRNGRSGNGGGGGGGAGGYSGTGGLGGHYNINPASGSGGGGGGGGACNGFTGTITAGGGGVMPYGEGANGARSTGNNTGSQTSIQGFQGSPVSASLNSSQYGGGGTGSEDDSGGAAGIGDPGVVRIIWGDNRQFPSTNTAESFSNGNVTTY